jgi:hypothetical protein
MGLQEEIKGRFRDFKLIWGEKEEQVVTSSP